jgi:hypothetical protein
MKRNDKSSQSKRAAQPRPDPQKVIRSFVRNLERLGQGRDEKTDTAQSAAKS